MSRYPRQMWRQTSPVTVAFVVVSALSAVLFLFVVIPH